MHWRKKLLQSSKLYLILDSQVNTYREILAIAKKAVNHGVGIMQLRDKTGTARDVLQMAMKIKQVTNNKSLFVVNDRVDIALAVQADMVHVGQNDLPVKEVRALVDKKMLIGQSCQTLAHAQKAVRDGADYIGLGSIFKTQTKPGRKPMPQSVLKKVLAGTDIPVFAIGGIDQEKIEFLASVGVKRFAVCRAVCQSADAVKTIQLFHKQIELSLRG